MSQFYLKTNRIYSPIRKYSWLFITLVAFGGLWYPKLGLLMIPLMLALGVLGFFKGKYWCGNICPHGSLFDFILMPVSLNKKIPTFLKSKTAITMAFVWFMAMLGTRLVKVFSLYGSASFWDKLGYIFVINYLMVTLLGSLLAVLISPRAWCSFCPMGTFQMLAYKLGTILKLNKTTDKKVTIVQKEMCHTCGKCSRVCPMQLTPYLEFSDKNQFDNEACIRCSTCVNNCPAQILSIDSQDNAEKTKAEMSIRGYENRQKVSARIKTISQLSSDVIEYTFTFEKPGSVTYSAGQFILIKIADNPIMYRAYSISSYNENGTELSATIKKVHGGYGTNIIFNTFTEGDIVELEGPMGRELVVDGYAKKVLFIAGGIGITPFVPMVRDVLENKSAVTQVSLVYGVNMQREFIYDEYFKNISNSNRKFEYIKVVASDESWAGKKGYVSDVIKEMDVSGYKIYMCGPLPMIHAVKQVLKDRNVHEEDIFFESA